MQASRHSALMAAEDRLAQRRRLNRQLVRPDRDPDSGAPLPLRVTRQTVHQAQQDVSMTLRRWMMLDELPPLEHVQDKPAEPAITGDLARALELAVSGHTKTEIARAMGSSYHRVDGWLRQGYAALGVHNRLEAAAAWRARTQGTPPVEGPRRVECPLTPRQQEVLALAAQGVRRRDMPARLGITPGGVHGLVHSVNRAFGVHSLAAAVQRYLALEQKSA